MNKSVRFGIIGTGGIARKFAAAVPLAAGAVLTACASRTPGKAETFAAEFGVPTYYDNYEDLLANPEIDCVYIATTPNFHYDNILTACARASTSSAKSRCSPAQATWKRSSTPRAVRVFSLMEAMWSRFLPSLQKVRDLIRSGELRAASAY